ncbi:predicted protein, partial [Naegleria gruberi]
NNNNNNNGNNSNNSNNSNNNNGNNKNLYGNINFYISMNEPGIFNVEMKLNKNIIGSIILEIDNLLDAQEKGLTKLTFEIESNNEHVVKNITLNVNTTLNTLNKLFSNTSNNSQ